MATYKFRDGFHVPRGVDAEQVANELYHVRGERDGITAAAVVEAARAKGSALHSIIFRLSDKEAAHGYRLDVARRLIRAVVVVREDAPEPTPVWVHVPAGLNEADRGGEYQPTATIVQRPDAFAAALSELQRRLNSARAAVDELQRVARDCDDADRLARIGMAVRALETASAAVSAIH